MEPPALKLEMVQGPREGDKLEFRSGSTIRIGRVVRGNNVTVKDAGISSKHLLIDSKSGKWIVQDLDSSNGTTLNSSKLPPFTPFDLRDGDTVKLGEYTSIRVHFIGADEPSQLRRNPRRQVNELDKKGSVAESRRRRPEVVVITEENSESKSEDVENLEESVPIEENRRRGRPRKGRVLDKAAEIDKESENLVPVAEKPKMQRITRNRKDDDCVILENLDGDCGKKKRGGRGRRKNSQEFPLENAQAGVLENENIDLGLNLREEAQAQTNEFGVSRDKEIEPEILEDEKKEGLEAETNCKEPDNRAGVDLKESDGKGQVNASENLGREQETFDLEKMTLGQWFDYMEVHLPKQIIEVTEEMLEEMRRKAERLKEYMIEQKKAKAMGQRTVFDSQGFSIIALFSLAAATLGLHIGCGLHLH